MNDLTPLFFADTNTAAQVDKGLFSKQSSVANGQKSLLLCFLIYLPSIPKSFLHQLLSSHWAHFQNLMHQTFICSLAIRSADLHIPVSLKSIECVISAIDFCTSRLFLISRIFPFGTVQKAFMKRWKNWKLLTWFHIDIAEKEPFFYAFLKLRWVSARNIANSLGNSLRIFCNNKHYFEAFSIWNEQVYDAETHKFCCPLSGWKIPALLK